MHTECLLSVLFDFNKVLLARMRHINESIQCQCFDANLRAQIVNAVDKYLKESASIKISETNGERQAFIRWSFSEMAKIEDKLLTEIGG